MDFPSGFSVKQYLARFPGNKDEAFRLWVCGTACLTILWTWRLWEVRADPPLLPLLDFLPRWSFAWPLLISLLSGIFLPRAGWAAFALVLGGAILADETRLQPQFFSFLVLLGGILPGVSGARLAARFYLASLWLYAGLHKLLSPAYLGEEGVRLFQGIAPGIPLDWLPALAGAVALAEILLGLGALGERTRKPTAWAAFFFHAFAFLSLSPLGRGENQSVWAWNLTLALAGFVYLYDWRDGPIVALRKEKLFWRAVSFLLLFYPLLYFGGLAHPHLAHCLYALNVPRAHLVRPAGESKTRIALTGYLPELRSFLPPTPRAFRESFRRTCRPGEELEIVYPPRYFFPEKSPERMECPRTP